MAAIFRKQDNWIHFSGIAGVALAPLAVALAEQGYEVTGSDENIFEPMASFIGSHTEIKVRTGYHFSNLIKSTYSQDPNDGQIIPAEVIAGGGLSLQNRELLFANKHGVAIRNYAEVLEYRALVQGSSIVVAGSFGKTTTTALLIKIFAESGVPISYMVGALVAGLDNGVKLKDASSKYSILEGDEYISSRNDLQSKFFHYHPTYLLLTGYAYDHTDVFTTPEAYYDNFAKLVRQLPAEGLLVYNSKYPELGDLAELAACKAIPYEEIELTNQLLGSFNKENISGAVTLAKALNLPAEKITKAVASFAGISRRLQIVAAGKDSQGREFKIVDDFGAAPAKAKSALSVLRAEFPEANIIAVFEPNLGNRTQEALPSFMNVFSGVNKLILPQFAKVKQTGILSELDLGAALEAQGQTSEALKDNQFLSERIESAFLVGKLNLVVFLSSHGVSNFISDLRQRLEER